jgi:hypothetical protein
VALPLGALTLAALLLGAKLVRETPTRPALEASAPVSTKAAARTTTREAPAVKRAPRRVASTREPKLRSTPSAPAPKASKPAKSGGHGWVIRRD